MTLERLTGPNVVVTALLPLFAAGCTGATSSPPRNATNREVRAATEAQATPVEWIKVRTDSGVITAAVARPQGDGPFPTLIILHGTHGFAEEYVQLARDLAPNGVLAVAACWFAGARGVGTRFITPIECADAPPFVDAAGPERFRVARRSVDALASAVRDLPGVRKERVVLFGHSRGGGAALDYVLLRTGRVSAAVLNSAGYPPEIAERASEIEVPLLILHGTDDSPADGGSVFTNVEMARRFESALRSAGKAVDAIYHDGGRHNSIFTAARQREDVVERVASFVRRDP